MVYRKYRGVLEAANHAGIAWGEEVIDALLFLNENVEVLKEMIKVCNGWNPPNVLVHGEIYPLNYGRFGKEGEGEYHKLCNWGSAFIGSLLVDLSIPLWEGASGYHGKLIGCSDDIDMPWKSLILDGDCDIGFRNLSRIKYLLNCLEDLRLFVRSHEIFCYSRVSRMLGAGLRNTVESLVKYVQELMEFIERVEWDFCNLLLNAFKDIF